MSSLGCTFDTARQALVDAITGTVLGDHEREVQVSYGKPLAYTALDVIAVLGDLDGDQAVHAGAERRESYTIPVCVSAARGDDDQRAATQRAITLAGYVEAALAEDPSLGRLVDMAWVGGRVSMIEVDPEQAAEQELGRITEIVLPVQIRNQAVAG